MQAYKIPLLILTAVLALGASGCVGPTASADKASNTMIVDYNPDSLSHYKTGRDLAAAGRYELAREYYLLALAASNDPTLQDALVFELDSIDLMIKSLR